MSVAHTTYPSIAHNNICEVALHNIVCDTSHFYKTWTTEELQEISLNDCPTKLILEPLNDGNYRLRFGIKYFLAANLSGVSSLPALILQTQQSNTSTPQLAADIFSWDYLDEIECAQAYQWLKDYYQYTTEQLATICAVSRPVISNQLRLLNLPMQIQGWLRKGQLNKSHCLLLLQLTSQAQQIELAKKIIATSPSVRQVKSMIQQMLPPTTIEHPTTRVSTSDKGIIVNESNQTITISYTSKMEKETLLHLLKTHL